MLPYTDTDTLYASVRVQGLVWFCGDDGRVGSRYCPIIQDQLYDNWRSYYYPSGGGNVRYGEWGAPMIDMVTWEYTGVSATKVGLELRWLGVCPKRIGWCVKSGSGAGAYDSDKYVLILGEYGNYGDGEPLVEHGDAEITNKSHFTIGGIDVPQDLQSKNKFGLLLEHICGSRTLSFVTLWLEE